MNKNKLTAAFLLASSLTLGACSNETLTPVDIKEKDAHWSVIYQKVADGVTKTELGILSDAYFGSSARLFTHIEDCRLKHLEGADIKTDFATGKQITLCSVERFHAANREELRDTLRAGFSVAAGLMGAVTALHFFMRRRKAEERRL